MLEGVLQPSHLLLILAIVLLMFGPQKLPQLGKGFGEAIRGFREGIRSAGDHSPEDPKEQKGPSRSLKRARHLTRLA